VASTISAMTLLPAGWILLRTESFEFGVFCACLYSACWIGLLWAVVLVGWSRGLFQPPPMAVVIGFSLLILSFAATVVLAAALARARGYQLVTDHRPPRGNEDGATL
jgi:hypothetical protein